ISERPLMFYARFGGRARLLKRTFIFTHPILELSSFGNWKTVGCGCRSGWKIGTTSISMAHGTRQVVRNWNVAFAISIFICVPVIRFPQDPCRGAHCKPFLDFGAIVTGTLFQWNATLSMP